MPKLDKDPLSKEIIESIRRGEQLIVLQNMPEWLAVADIFEKLSRVWKSALLRIDSSDTLERIALERVKSVFQLNGLETFFRVMQDDIDSAKQYDDEEELKKEKIK